MPVEVGQLVNASATVVDSTRPQHYDLIDLPLSDPNPVVTNGQKKAKSQPEQVPPSMQATTTQATPWWRQPGPIIAIIALLVGPALWVNYFDSTRRATDEHIEHVIAPKFDAVTSRLDVLMDRISKLEGKLRSKRRNFQTVSSSKQL